MSDAMQIRTVTVELLRPGPAHNQLLSPLTQYLGMCDDAEAGIVTLPYEHAAFLRRMKSMRYVSAEDSDRLPVLREMGIEMAKVLGAIPRLPGSLAGGAGGPDTLVHLRLVLSAAELASLPFELAKVPIGPGAWAEGLLSLQARMPVVITRRTRNVSTNGVQWPSRPRILFIAADPAEIPFEEHRRELVEALQPFLYPGRDNPVLSADGRREQFGNILTIIKNARFNDVAAECAANRYTHIHILAHGDKDPEAEDTSYALVLHTDDNDPDVISGERFASAFTCLVGDAIQRPAVVTLASCDSGNDGSVIIPGGSIAHVLHQAGIPLVIASQFPLSKEGSTLVVRELYRGLLWGESPWLLLHRIRTALHGRLTAHSHDWASLVVYEALPANLDEQIEAARYSQGKLAIDAALERIDRAVLDSGAALDGMLFKQLTQAVVDAGRKLPMEDRFAMECLGLLGSSQKRLALAEFNIALAAGPDARAQHVLESCAHLDQALQNYEQAATGFLVNQGQAVQRMSSLHWVLVQQLCLAAVLGKPVREGTWETARLSAESYLDLQEVDERAWAHGSLAELWLLKLTDATLSAAERDDAARLAREHVTELMKLFRSGDAFAIQSTRKQFARYVDWWSHPLFEHAIVTEAAARSSWTGLGVVTAAAELAGILERRGASTRAAAAASTSTATSTTTTLQEPAAASGALPALQPLTSPLPTAEAVQPTPTTPERAGNLTATTRTKTTTHSSGPFFEIEMLPAGHGDCLWIQYGEAGPTSRVLIDCGTDATYPWLQKRVAQLPTSARDFELFILSHIDADHIGGAIPFFADQTLGVRVADVWFNGYKHLTSTRLGAKQGEIFSTLIQKYKLPWNLWRKGGAIVLAGGELPTCTLPGGMQLTLLSPSPEKLTTLASKWEAEIKKLDLTPGKAADFEKYLGRTVSKSTNVETLADAKFTADTAAPNGSSIAVLAEYQGKRALFGADAHAPLLVASIRKLLKQRGATKLKLDAFKVSHHASQNNLNVELMQLLDCKNYLISTNGKIFNHPDREAIGRVIHYGGEQPRLWFNYRTGLNDVWEQPALQQKYRYETTYPKPGQEGMIVRL